MTTILLVIFITLCLSAFFSASETALTAASRPRMHALAQQGNQRARNFDLLREQMELVIATILLGNTFVNTVGSAIATAIMIRLYGDQGAAYAAIVMTVLLILFGEVMPKTYAINRADTTALAVTPIMRFFVPLISPLTRLVRWFARRILSAIGLRITAELGSDLTEAELRGAIDLHVKAAAEVRQAGMMLHSILDLDEVAVSDIMVHRRNVVMIDADEPAEKIVEAVLASPYTRIPLYRGDADNIIGVLHVKALLRAVQARLGDITGLDIAKLAAPPWFIPDGTTLLRQLQAFRSRREHFALVVDEYGVLMGIVTLEDILEEIVGEIEDEHDIRMRGVTKENGGYIVNGQVTIRDLNREFGWRLPDEFASTVAGLVLYEARRIPEEGQVFVFHNLRFEILRRQRNRIEVLRITPSEESKHTATS